MQIRRAEYKDLKGINNLLCQVLEVHHEIRPDIFRAGTKKYTDEELYEIIKDDLRPVFVADDNGEIEGYAFCVFQNNGNSHVLTDIKTLYIDDLCVNEKARGKHIGKTLYEYVARFAKNEGCYNVTLNVWAGNENAIKFYEKMGLMPQKFGMEKIL